MRPELVRVPRAFGSGGEAMEAAAAMPLGFDEAATIASVRARFDGPVALVWPGDRFVIDG